MIHVSMIFFHFYFGKNKTLYPEQISLKSLLFEPKKYERTGSRMKQRSYVGNDFLLDCV